MFPDARISLRRWSCVSAETKIPIPMAITLHNYIAPSSTNNEQQSCSTNHTNRNDSESPSCSPSKEEDAARRDRGMWLNRQPQHNNNLLPRLRLEITATPPCHREQDKGGDNNGGEGTSTTQTLVYSKHSPQTPSLHPSWDHLDERISIQEYDDWWNQNKLYKSMKIKISVVSNSDEEDHQQECQQQGMYDDYFIESYLHPSFLERIDLVLNNSNKNDSTDDIDPNSLLPPGLPPNAMLVHFSDGSIRCPPHTFKILWDNYGHSHGILEPPPVEDFSRFEDDAFATLDHVNHTPQRPRNRSISSLLDHDHDYCMNKNAQTGNNKIDEDGFSGNLPQDEKNSSLSEDHPCTPPLRNFVSGEAAEKNSSEIPRNQTYQHRNDVSFRFKEQDILKKERRQEKLDLLRLIAEEERALEGDLDSLKVEQQTLTHLVEEIQVAERDIFKVKAEFHKQSLKLEREEILKESQSVKLLRDLKVIYPIALDSAATLSSVSIIQSTRGSGGTAGGTGNSGGNNGYLIRGLRLPADIYTTSISEEEVNTSLGYCAHLVFMVAKYLSIQPRHRIFCNGSRSAIEFDGAGIFPLFLGRLAARALEREQVDRGARLLGSNVDCIMMHLNLLPSSQSSSPLQQRHILARLQMILDFVSGDNLSA